MPWYARMNLSILNRHLEARIGHFEIIRREIPSIKLRWCTKVTWCKHLYSNYNWMDSRLPLPPFCRGTKLCPKSRQH